MIKSARSCISYASVLRPNCLKAKQNAFHSAKWQYLYTNYENTLRICSYISQKKYFFEKNLLAHYHTSFMMTSVMNQTML